MSMAAAAPVGQVAPPPAPPQTHASAAAAAARAAAEALRASGNAAFGERSFERAAALYARGLSALLGAAEAAEAAEAAATGGGGGGGGGGANYAAALSTLARSLPEAEQVAVRAEAASLLTNRSNALLLHGDAEGALATAAQALALDPRWSKGYLRLGAAFAALRRPGEAADTFAAALQACRAEERTVFEAQLLAAELASPWGRLVPRWYVAVYALRDGAAVVALVDEFRSALESELAAGAAAAMPASVGAARRAWLARASLFVGLCLSDRGASHEDGQSSAGARAASAAARAALRRAIELDAAGSRLAFVELALMYEQSGDLAGARAVAALPGAPWSDPLQRPGFVVPGLKAQSFWSEPELSPAAAAWVAALESSWEQVLRELLALMAQPRWPRVGDRHHLDAEVVAQGSWTEQALFGAGSREGAAPFTQALLRRLAPEVVDLCEKGGGEVVFSRLAPRTHIRTHCAPSNHRLTAHLGLVVPPDAAGRCKIRVGHEWRGWQPGKVLLFDDAFEHEVANETPQERVVLLLRFPHPQAPRGDALAASLLAASQARDRLLRRRSLPPLRADAANQLEALLWEGCERCGAPSDQIQLLSKDPAARTAARCAACGATKAI